jgi:hypothetical protein
VGPLTRGGLGKPTPPSAESVSVGTLLLAAGARGSHLRGIVGDPAPADIDR